MASQETTGQEDAVATVPGAEGPDAPPQKTELRKFEEIRDSKWIQIDEEETEDESVRQATVFKEIARVFLGILKSTENPNLKVKHIALYKLFPKLVNISLPIVQNEHSEYFMRILVRGCKIEWGPYQEKIKHFNPQLELASDLVRSGGLVLNENLDGPNYKNFKRVLLCFKRCYIEQREPLKREVLRLMLMYC